jgi:hypothetical protein
MRSSGPSSSIVTESSSSAMAFTVAHTARRGADVDGLEQDPLTRCVSDDELYWRSTCWKSQQSQPGADDGRLGGRRTRRSHRRDRSALKVLIIDGSSPVAAPAPTTIGEDAHDRVSRVQPPGINAVAIEVWRRVLGLEGTRPVDVGMSVSRVAWNLGDDPWWTLGGGTDAFGAGVGVSLEGGDELGHLLVALDAAE